jgi:hypothetical protein
LTKLVVQLLRRNPDASPREEAVRVQVRVFLEGVKKLLSKKGKPNVAQSVTDETNIAKLFEEIKVMVRELPERVDSRMRTASKSGLLRHRPRFHPTMFEELLYDSALRKSRNGAAIVWLIFLSILRDDLPWIYEIGLELYNALKSGDTERISETRNDLHIVLEATMHGPLSHEAMRPGDEEIYYMIKHLPEMIEHFLDRSILKPQIRLNRKAIARTDNTKKG